MASNRVEYGIDLGTTNSALARMKRGEPEVVRQLGMGRDTMPSAVFFGRRGRLRVRVGSVAYQQLGQDRLLALKADRDIRNTFVEFKRTMGLDHVYTPSVDPSARYTSEMLSAEVLKELRGYVTDDVVRAAVVTIPSAFKVAQQQATLRAAELAGIRQCHLLQEPVAAARAAGLTAESRNGKWLVFDFGGGTFDAALVVIEDGQITVKDTEGDNHLGGRDLDYAVVDQIMLVETAKDYDIQTYVAGNPDRERRLRDALKHWAEQARIALSFRESHFVESGLDEIELGGGEAITLEFRITREDLRVAVTPIYQRAIDKSQTLLARHGLRGQDLDELILVGGPTYSSIVREMLAQQIRDPNTTVDPMTIVAQGAALYGNDIRDITPPPPPPERLLRLDVDYAGTSLHTTEFVTVKLSESASPKSRALEVELSRVGWSSGRHPIGEQGALLEVALEDGKANVFAVRVTTARGDRVETDCSEITIIQGTRPTGSPLPNSLGVEVELDGGRRVFEPLRGAEKSKPLPVTGIRKGLRTPAQLRPGVPGDRLSIRIYEGGADAPGTKAIYSEHVGSLELTGGQVNRVIPAGSRFDLTVKTDDTCSVPVRVSLFFEALDEEYDLPIPDFSQVVQDDWIEDELQEAKYRLNKLLGTAVSERLAIIQSRLNEFGTRVVDSADPDSRTQAVARIRELLRELDHLEAEAEWPMVKDALDEAWAHLRRAFREEGYPETLGEPLEFRTKYDQVAQKQDPSLARELIEEMRQAFFHLKRCEMAVDYVQWARANFSRLEWKDVDAARRAVHEGVQALVANRPCSEIIECAGRIWELVKHGDLPLGEGGPPVPKGGFS